MIIFAINLFMCNKDEVGRVDQRLLASTDHMIKRLKVVGKRLKMGGKRQCRENIGRSGRLKMQLLAHLCVFGGL